MAVPNDNSLQDEHLNVYKDSNVVKILTFEQLFYQTLNIVGIFFVESTIIGG